MALEDQPLRELTADEIKQLPPGIRAIVASGGTAAVPPPGAGGYNAPPSNADALALAGGGPTALNAGTGVIGSNAQPPTPPAYGPKFMSKMHDYWSAEADPATRDKIPEHIRRDIEDMRSRGRLPGPGAESFGAMQSGAWQPQPTDTNVTDTTTLTPIPGAGPVINGRPTSADAVFSAPTSAPGQLSLDSKRREIGTLGGATTGALGAAKFVNGLPIPRGLKLPADMIASIIGATVGGFGGGGIGEATAPSPLPVLPRFLRAGTEGAKFGAETELANQTLLRPAIAAVGATGQMIREATPGGQRGVAMAAAKKTGEKLTARDVANIAADSNRLQAEAEAEALANAKSNEERIRISNLFGGTQDVAARDVANNYAPGVQQSAAGDINQSLGAAQQQAAQAESDLPRNLRLRSDRLDNPTPPQPVGPTVSPILAPVGRGLNAEAIITPARTKVLQKLTERNVPSDLADGRRLLEQMAGEAQDVNTLLKGVRDAVGPINTVRILAQNPDTMTQLYRMATPEERPMLEWALNAGKQLDTPAGPMRLPEEMPADLAAKARDLAKKSGLDKMATAQRAGDQATADAIEKAADAKYGWPRSATWAARYALMGGLGIAGGHRYGLPGAMALAPMGLAIEKIVGEKMIGSLFDKFVNSNVTRAAAGATGDLMRASGRSAIGTVMSERNQENQGGNP